ncbi:MAG TPA: alpha/beta hydrolase [Solirubrobacteraceae bacterium]|jgi:pimeloyl-ACP methyl ester carboxylesterase
MTAEISPALYRAGFGEQVVLLHGFTGAWHHWRPLLSALTARYEVIAPTLAGHDGGPPFPEIAVSFASACDSVERHLDDLGLGSAHFVGNSLGGGLALELAKRGRARSVVALAPAGGWSDGDGEARRLARFFAQQIRVTRMTARAVPTVMARPRSRRLAMRDIMRHGERMSAAEAVDLARASARCSVSEAALAALRADSGLALRDLDRISCPVLLASPEFDRVLPAERNAQRFRREIPGVEWRTLPDCGHVPMWDAPESLVQMIGELVDRSTTTNATNGTAAIRPDPTDGPRRTARSAPTAVRQAQVGS